MTNETKPSTRRQIVEVAVVLAVIGILAIVPFTRVALTTSWETFVEVVRQTPGEVFTGLQNVWNWLF